MSANQIPAFVDDEPPPEAPREGWTLVRIHVPELDIYKCLQFPIDKLLWDVKQQVLASLPKELKESFNYGLFQPPSNGKAGKFLDEERRLGDYPFSGPVGYLELKYKRRVYKMLTIDERQLRALHSRSNLRRCLEYVNAGQVDKLSKMCAKGLDPNFHCQDSGETPLSIAALSKKPQKLLIALVNGGALLDYRTKDGSTALHRAVEKDSYEAVSTLLELGASPNYRDGKNLTPVYLSITKKADPKITEALLHDHATLGTQDSQGWNEVHQICRHGMVQHLEHLLMYGADMDSKNASGNTPLHVCAVNNQEACARMLLFRGANHEALNYANQTPYQVAVIASNFELAEMIQNYKPEDIVPFRAPPRYNPRRRSGLGFWMNYQLGSNGSETYSTLRPTSSIGSTNSSWANSHYHAFVRLMSHEVSLGLGPPSPCPSDHPFNSASSSLSESSSSHRSQEDDISIVTDKSLGDTSDIISDSSGVGTNSESATCSIGHPSTTVVCIEKYESNTSGHLSLQPGEVIEVVGSTDCGLLEGYVRGTTKVGFFPTRYVQEVQFRQKNITNVSIASTTSNQVASNTINNNHQPNTAVNGSSFEQIQQQQMSQPLQMHQPQPQQYNSLTAPRSKNFLMPEPRTVILHRAKRGFGFVLRGAKAASPLMQLKPSPRCPALQYLDDVDPGGVADLAGLLPGDFLLAINGEDVTCASHEHVVEIIRTSSSVVNLTVLTLPSNENLLNNNPTTNNTINYARNCSTLPRRLSGPGKLPAPAPPRRIDSKLSSTTSMSVGRARARSMVAGLENDDNSDGLPKASSVESINQQALSALSTPTQGTPIQIKSASIKCRPTSSRITAAELEDLFSRQQSFEENIRLASSMMTTSRFQSNGDSSLTPQASPSKGPLTYASMAELKRKKTRNGTLNCRPVAIPTVIGELKRNFHSTPDLANNLNGSATWSTGSFGSKNHMSQEDMQSIHSSIQRLNLPPPDHPPPPIPAPVVGQVVKVDVSRKSDYESTTTLQAQIQAKIAARKEQQEIASSFKPTSNAKMYASPQDLNIQPSMAFRPANNNNNGNTKIAANGVQNPTSTTTPTTPSTTTNAANSQHIQAVQANEQNVSKVNVAAIAGNLNPYAQPGRAGVEPAIQTTDANLPAPPIPDPDYSMSESEEEGDNSVKLAATPTTTSTSSSTTVVSSNVPKVPNNFNAVILKPVENVTKVELRAREDIAETSGNSNTSGSSTGSGAISHSFSADEIQRMRTKLKPSKSFPNVLQNGNIQETEGDNSSSGVSSDQEIVVNAVSEVKLKPTLKNQQVKQPEKIVPRKIVSTEDARSDEDSPSPPFMGFQRNNSLTRKQAAIIAANRARSLAQAQNAVSLTQLPPPIEADSEDEVDGKNAPCIVAPPPPEFSDIVSSTRSLHIPTQPTSILRQQHQQHQQHPPSNHYYIQQQLHSYMLNQQHLAQQRSVRIVGALPKQGFQPGFQQHPQPMMMAKQGHHHLHHYHSHNHHQHQSKPF